MKSANYVACCKMDGTGDHTVEWNKPLTQRQELCFLSFVEEKRKQNTQVIYVKGDC
jgi:hypothetical protein